MTTVECIEIQCDSRMFHVGGRYEASPRGVGRAFEIRDDLGLARVIVVEQDGSARFIVDQRQNNRHLPSTPKFAIFQRVAQ